MPIPPAALLPIVAVASLVLWTEEARKLIVGIDFAASAMDAVKDADAVILVTEWGEFLDLDWAAVAGAMAGTVVIDGRNALDRGAVEAAGLSYEGIGR